MKLSDIMSAAGLSGYAEIALVLFLGVFIAVTLRTYAPSRRRDMDAAALLPLQDDVIVPPSQER